MNSTLFLNILEKNQTKLVIYGKTHIKRIVGGAIILVKTYFATLRLIFLSALFYLKKMLSLE